MDEIIGLTHDCGQFRKDEQLDSEAIKTQLDEHLQWHQDTLLQQILNQLQQPQDITKTFTEISADVDRWEYVSFSRDDAQKYAFSVTDWPTPEDIFGLFGTVYLIDAQNGLTVDNLEIQLGTLQPQLNGQPIALIPLMTLIESVMLAPYQALLTVEDTYQTGLLLANVERILSQHGITTSLTDALSNINSSSSEDHNVTSIAKAYDNETAHHRLRDILSALSPLYRRSHERAVERLQTMQGREPFFTEKDARLSEPNRKASEQPRPVRTRFIGSYSLPLDLGLKQSQVNPVAIDTMGSILCYHGPLTGVLSTLHQHGSEISVVELIDRLAFMQGIPILKIAPRLEAYLANTDIGGKLPMSLLKTEHLDSHFLYIETAPGFMIQSAPDIPPSPMEGFYINYKMCTEAETNQLFNDPKQRESIEHLFKHDVLRKEDGPVFMLDILGSARPIDHVLGNDNYMFTLLVGQDNDVSIERMLDAWLSKFDVVADNWEKQQIKRVVEHVAKCMLYTRLDSKVVNDINEATELVTKLSGLKNPSKRRKLQNRMQWAHDYTLIDIDGTLDKLAHQKSPHIRRGHFRQQRHGKDNRETKVIYIQPTIIGAKLATVD